MNSKKTTKPKTDPKPPENIPGDGEVIAEIHPVEGGVRLITPQMACSVLSDQAAEVKSAD